MTDNLLQHIDSPSDLRKLSIDQLPQVCEEIRQHIINNLCSNPGHFASSMGAVEIAVALHYVFDTPNDHLVWDVGHQAYPHKILTGRRDDFDKLRRIDGISGFPKPSESEYDSFTAGHAGNSISAALGMAIADSLTPGHENRKTVAVIGDASIGNGLAFEGLNNASNSPNNLLIILNDNDMSIDNNVGALHHYLTEMTTSARYNRWRQRIYNFFKNKGMVDESRRGRLLRFNNSLKAFISGGQNIFEGLNIRYFGPFDGHDVTKIVRVLKEIKDMTGPRLLHLRTVKGKGYPEAEKDPTTWHAPGKFDPATGQRSNKSDTPRPPKWQDVMGLTLVELAETDPNIVGITAAMPSGTSMNKMMNRFPERTFDVGISEGHAVTFAGGLASQGKKPFVAIYSSFLQRAYDNIIHDVAIQNLPVVLCIDRAGVVGEDGVTHHGLFDLAYLRCIPGMTIASPMDEETMRNLMFTAKDYTDGPIAIRYPRGEGVTIDWQTPMHSLTPGKGRILQRTYSAKTAILSIGMIGHEAAKAVKALADENIEVDHYDMIWLKPLDEELMAEIASRYEKVVTVEDGTTEGGFGSAVEEWLNDHGHNIHVTRLGVPATWVHHGTPEQLHRLCGYDADSIANTLRSINQSLKDLKNSKDCSDLKDLNHLNHI